MRLTAFRVQDYRSIEDSGWVEIEDIAVIVGKNESGKTSFLKALWKFNPFHDEGYILNREWPRGRRKEMSPEKIVVTTKFAFNEDEMKAMEAIHESTQGVTGVEIKRNYKGEYFHNFLPKNPNEDHDLEWVVTLLKSRLGEVAPGFSDHFKDKYNNALNTLIENIRDQGGSDKALENLPVFKKQLSSFRSPNTPAQQQDDNLIPPTIKVLDEVLDEIQKTPMLRVIDYVHDNLPTFIYMDDYMTFIGTAQLNEVLNHKKSGKLSPTEETVIVIMNMAGLDLDEEVRKGNESDREQRILDMNDASQTLTNLISDRWSQKKYEVMFQADGQHFITFVKDLNDKVLVPLEERSRGFQWFFSFDMLFMHETRGKFQNAIILLDEPGLHLHATAQRDLLDRIKSYSKNNQLIYTTHLPFMIDFKRLDNIYVAEECGKNGTKVHKNWATADKDARFTLQAALGLSWSQSLFVGHYNLIVEGVDDFWFLTVFSTLFEEAGQPGLHPELVVTPAGGASKVAYVGTILHAQELQVAVLLDSDMAGQKAFEQLVHEWILKDKLVLMLGDILGASPCALEDLFGETYYLEKVNECYSKELKGKPINLDAKTAGKKTFVDRVEDAFKKLGLADFNKGRVAKKIMTDLAKKNLASLDKEVVAKFRLVIDAINNIVTGWKS